MKSLRSAILLAVICLSATPRGVGSTQGAPDRAPVFGAPTNESPLSPVSPLNVDLAQLLTMLSWIKVGSILTASKVCDMQTRITDIQTMVGGVISTAIDDILSKVCDIQTRAEDIDTKVDDVQMRVPIIESKVCDIQTRVEDIDTQVDDIFVRVPVIESKVCDIQTRVLDVDTHIDDILTKVCDIDTKVDHLFDESCPNLIRQSDMPFTISSPGFYCLAEDVSFSSGSAGICIDADCVVFDLNSHSITNTLGSGGSAVEVAANRAHIKIRNGTIVGSGIGGDLGVDLPSSSSFISVCNLRLRDMISGFQIQGSSQVVRDCVVSCASNAFRVISGSDIIFENCIAFETFGTAFFFISGSSVCALRCQAFNTGGDGFCVNTGSSLLRNCISKGAVSRGFFFGASNSVVEECVAIGGSTGGFRVNISDVAILGCVAENNAGDGIEIDNNLNGVVLKENQCHHNGGFGILVGAPMGIGHEIVNNFAFDNAGGNFSPFVPASCQGIAPKPMVEDTLSKVCELRELACTNLISQSDMNPTFTITSPGLYCLTEDVSFSPASAGILIDADCVVLDLNSHSITVPASGCGVEVAAGRAHIEIRNGVVVGGAEGVDLASSSSFVFVHDVRVRDSIRGFLVRGSEHVLRECASSCLLRGFEMNNASSVVLEQCQAYVASIGFIVFNFSNKICLFECTALDATGDGFTLGGDFILLRECIAKGSSGSGFTVGSAGTGTNNVLQECVASGGSGVGFLVGAADQLLIGCVAENNSTTGINLLNAADGTVLKETHARNNGANGILLTDAVSCGIEGCHCSGNTADGISLSGSDNCVIKNCVIEQNGGVGIDLIGTTTFCIVRDNDLTDNASFAIRDAITNQNHILHNFAANNNGGGANYSGVDASIITGPVPAAGGPFDNFSNTGA